MLGQADRVGAAVLGDVTIAVCWNEVAGAGSWPTIADEAVFACQEGSAMIARPPGECGAPTTKSLWPPKPEWIRPHTKSEWIRPRTHEVFACACRSTW